MAMIERETIRNRLLTNRGKNKKGLITYVNAGDPSLHVTEGIIGALAQKNVDVIELGVPFPDSFTDGKVILKSHERALNQRVDLENVLSLVEKVRESCTVPIVILAEYSHTVKPLGLTIFLEKCKNVGVDGILLHSLPPLLVRQYWDTAHILGLESIFSLYPNTTKEKRMEVYDLAMGFIYVVSYYGKTGKSLSKDNLDFVKKLRIETDMPLAVGFGVKSKRDVEIIHDSGADAAIIGTSIMAIVDQFNDDPKKLIQGINEYIDSLRMC